ncbi:hypothetical protein [Desulfogranum japonicum]|uniref:hypothetical protein n=1 Tax=Desulfogranum japonicum TaxID=231447 RepID=UPI00048E7FB4|nr:hypothetical protein [Desulfogranum japonicum]
MDTSFFSPAEIKQFIEHNTLRNEINSGSTIGICSIGDTLHALEDHRKGASPISLDVIDRKIRRMEEDGFVCISELDEEKLLINLFERDGNDIVVGLSVDAAVSHIPPRRSIRILSLKLCGDSTWWTDRVEKEMEEYHQGR